MLRITYIDLLLFVCFQFTAIFNTIFLYAICTGNRKQHCDVYMCNHHITGSFQGIESMASSNWFKHIWFLIRLGICNSSAYKQFISNFIHLKKNYDLISIPEWEACENSNHWTIADLNYQLSLDFSIPYLTTGWTIHIEFGGFLWSIIHCIHTCDWWTGGRLLDLWYININMHCY